MKQVNTIGNRSMTGKGAVTGAKESNCERASVLMQGQEGTTNTTPDSGL